ncbi:MAG: polysaccharide pyruvyl transferase family protein [Coriobacteriia bacterium]|nr:polysaccharide pyruvyl transferase family protein [Coriobacteriia bacterium]
MRLLFINAYSPMNLGDGAIVLRMLDEARRVFGGDVEIIVSATEPEPFLQLGIAAMPRPIQWRPLGSPLRRLAWLLRALPDALLLALGSAAGRPQLARVARSRLLSPSASGFLQAMLRADLVIATGGGYLADYYARQFPFWHLQYRCARAAGVPLVFFSQSIGPLTRRIPRLWVSAALGHSETFCARDESSALLAERLGARRVVRTLDVALLSEAPPALSPGKDPHTLGISLVRWPNLQGDPIGRQARYLDAAERAVRLVHESDPQLSVLLFSTNKRSEANVADDVSVAEEMRERLAAEGVSCELVPWTPLPEEFCSAVGRCSLFVASRMHSAVLAACAGVPVVGVAYEPKLSGLLSALGFGALVVPMEAPDALPGIVSEAWRERDSLAARLPEAMRKARLLAQGAMEACAEVLGVRPASAAPADRADAG